jgi:radical SAM protein with 4Fe4S-binding SPASM domain
MVMRSNVNELPEISNFCRAMTRDFYRFDPLLHLRYDGNASRNDEIKAERLSAEEIVAVEQADAERAGALQRDCAQLISPEMEHTGCNHLFHCGAGKNSFSVGYDGTFKLCSALIRPDCVYDLRQGSLAEAWNRFVPQVRDRRSEIPDFLDHCRSCPLVNLCLWCPANANLECGRMEGRSEYFCRVANARAQAIRTQSELPSKRSLPTDDKLLD